MAVISHIDGVNRLIYLHADTQGSSVHPIDIYKEMRTFRRTDESLRKFKLFLEAKGNDPKGSGKFTERYVVCLDGTRIVPYDASGTLTVTGTIITDDGQEGIACFDKSVLTPTSLVDIAYVPPQVEIIQLNPTSGLSVEESQLLQEIHNSQYRRRVYDKNTNTITIYLSDNVTPDKVFDTNGDLSDITPQ